MKKVPYLVQDKADKNQLCYRFKHIMYSSLKKISSKQYNDIFGL